MTTEKLLEAMKETAYAAAMAINETRATRRDRGSAIIESKIEKVMDQKTRMLDRLAEDAALEYLKRKFAIDGRSHRIWTEESTWVGNRRLQVRLYLDPLNETRNAIHGLGGDVGLIAFNCQTTQIISVVVVDTLTYNMYWADGQSAWFRNGETGKECILDPTPRSEQIIISFNVHSSLRLEHVYKNHQPLLEWANTLVLGHGGSLMCCRVGDGDITAHIETAKGYALHDLAGALIAYRAGCAFISLEPNNFGESIDVKKLPWENPAQRTKFLIAANDEVANKILSF